MKIEITELKALLSALKPGLSSGKETTEQSNHFAFVDGFIHSYNDEISVRVPSPLDFTGVVPAKDFLNLVNKQKGEIDISLDNGEMLIKRGRSRAGIKLEQDILMPIDEIQYPKKKKDWNTLPKDFHAGLKSVLFSVSNDASTPIITAVHCIDDILESTDRDRATRWILDNPIRDPFLLPGPAGKALVSSCKHIERYVVDDSWVHFDVGNNVIFSARIIEGDYPDLEDFFNTDGNKLVLPEETKDIIDRAEFATDTEDEFEYITISIDEKGMLKIRAEKDSAWYEEPKRIRNHDGSAYSFMISPTYLLQILGTTHDTAINERLLKFESEKFQHIVSLLVEA